MSLTRIFESLAKPASGKGHTILCVVAHGARQSPSRNGRGTAWCATSRSKKVARQRGSGIVDSLSPRSGNLDVQLGRQRLLFAPPMQASLPVQSIILVMLASLTARSSFGLSDIPWGNSELRLDHLNLLPLARGEEPWVLICKECAQCAQRSRSSFCRNSLFLASHSRNCS